MVYYVAQHINHFVGCTFTDDFVCFGNKRSNDIAVVVLYACYVERFSANPLVGKGGIGIYHFLHTHFARTETETDDRIELSLNTKRLHYTYQLFWRIKRHQIGGYPVGRVLQSPIEGYNFALVFSVRIARCPRASIGII